VEGSSVNPGQNQSYALVIVAPSTASVQEIACTSEFVKTPSECSNNDDSKDDETALIVGLVVGILGFLAIASAVYFCCFYSKRSMGSNGIQLQGK